MTTSRRSFMTTALRHAAGAGLVATGAAGIRANAAEDAAVKAPYQMFPIGRVEKADQAVRIRLFDAYAEGLLGLDGWSHLNVFYWFDQNDTPQQRRVLRVHPRGDKKNPLTGVFACRAPVRPNLIALSVCRILSVRGSIVTVDELDAFDGTPVLDLKPLIPPDAPDSEIRVPDWARQGRPSGR